MVLPLVRKTPEVVREAYRHWLRLFGPPSTLAVDLGREFEGSFSLRAETDGTFLDPSSVESPYQRGITERAGKTFKMMLSKAMETYVCTSEQQWRELVDVVNMQKNRLLLKSGFSAMQRVLGYTPKIPGGLLSDGGDNLGQPEHVRLGDEGVRQSMEMRKAAAVAFHETDCSEALRRALAAGPRPMGSFEIGETVYFWRVGMSAAKKAAPAYWHGPARVVMTHLPSTVWLSYQGTLVKASPEQVRRISEEEQITLSGWIDSLMATRDALNKEPKRGYLDLSQDPLPPADDESLDEEDTRPPDEDHRVTHRIHDKTTPSLLHGPTRRPLPIDLDPETPEEVQDVPMPVAEIPPAREHIDEETPEAVQQGEKRELEIEESTAPEAKRSRLEFLEIYLAKVNALTQARQRKEVQMTGLSDFNQKCFTAAMKKEVDNNLQTGAYKFLSLEESALVRQTEPDKVMESRYVVTAKPLEETRDASLNDPTGHPGGHDGGGTVGGIVLLETGLP